MYVWIRAITPRLGASELKQQEARKLDPENESLWDDPNYSRVIFKDKKQGVNQGPGWGDDDDYFCSFVAERLREEALEETDDLQLADECDKELVEADNLSRRDKE